ncbi:MAG: hypothetical protein U1E83_11730 [Methylotetracoccus sp.]
MSGARCARGCLGSFMRLLMSLAATLVFAACVHEPGRSGSSPSRNDTLRAYQNAIRWNHFDEAAAFQNGVTRPSRATDRMRESIRVRRYDVIRAREDTRAMTLHQTVNIRYHHIGESVEKDIVDEQDWHFDPERGVWVLDTGLPRFE